ncbi:MAG: metal ABC transporter substrate-binding protein [Gammaproteobacteria bacterium]|jgi:zinc transport system substrate-binding protein
MNTRTRLAGWVTILLCLTACQRAEEDPGAATEPQAADARITVYAVNYPLAWMAERIGGDSVDVSLPVPDGVDPAHWQPSPETVLDYQRADLVLLNGAGYAGWIQFASLSPGRLVDTTGGLAERFVPAGEVTHSHGPGGEHDHADVASHTWLDPGLAAEQARAIAEAFGRLAPTHEGEFQQRLQSVRADLAQLDQRFAAAFRDQPDVGVLYSHPVYQYLDARYGLEGRSVTWEPFEDPGEAQWNKLADSLNEQPASVMLWEAEPLSSTAERLRRMGIEPVVFDTGAAPPAAGDYLTLMDQNLERLDRLEPADGETDN